MSEPSNGEIMQAIGHLQGTVEGMSGNLEAGAKRMDSQSRRIGAVENKQAWYLGALATLTAAGGIIVKFFMVVK